MKKWIDIIHSIFFKIPKLYHKSIKNNLVIRVLNEHPLEKQRLKKMYYSDMKTKSKEEAGSGLS